MKPYWFGGYSLIVVLALLIYVPLILFGGFGTSDDVSLVAHIGPDYLQDLVYSLSRSGHISRPLYGFIQTTSLHLFGFSYILYNVFRFILWGILLLLAHIVFKKLLGDRVSLFFLFFISFPVFASSQLFNSMQMGYILSVIFYLLALRSIQELSGQFTKESYRAYFLWSLLALLSCEIVFPLFVFPILQLWPKSKDYKRFKNLCVTTALVFGLILLLKFVAGPFYQIGDAIYGFSFSVHSLLQGIYYFFALLIELPLLLIEVVPFYFSEPLLWLSVLVVPLVYFSRSAMEIQFDKRIFFHAILTIVSCCSIFILSDYPAVTYGLYNKMLLPSHLFVALVLSIICVLLLRSKFYLCSYLIAILWFASMEMQVINSIRSWELRNKVLQEVIPVLKNIKTEQFVFAEVPYFLPSNYNNEPVFSLIDDFQGGLKLNGCQRNPENIFPYTSKMILDSSYWYRQNMSYIILKNNIEDFTCLKPLNMKFMVHTYDGIEEFSTSQFFIAEQECFRADLRGFLSNKFLNK